MDGNRPICQLLRIAHVGAIEFVQPDPRAVHRAFNPKHWHRSVPSSVRPKWEYLTHCTRTALGSKAAHQNCESRYKDQISDGSSGQSTRPSASVVRDLPRFGIARGEGSARIDALDAAPITAQSRPRTETVGRQRLRVRAARRRAWLRVSVCRFEHHAGASGERTINSRGKRTTSSRRFSRP